MKEKKLIQALGYLPKENTSEIYSKNYGRYCIEVDFKKQKFNYGNEIKLESSTTLNFSQAENWVIFECIDRLLEKGYKPKDITLEKTFKLGHGSGGGRLDIFIEKDGKAFLMIECKTYGKEYKKEFANINKHGGQLFTYFQNNTNAEYLMLYSSDIENDVIKTQQSIIKIEDHYRDAGNVVDVYERWNKITLDNGIFETWVKPYNFENKRITKNELIPLDKEASNSLFHSFVSILRKHSVSDKANAFNVIFDLFLAKLWDEKKEDHEEMHFQWRENEDDPVIFQYRLLDLYKDGMYDFLKKQVFGLADNDFKVTGEKDLKAIKKKVLMLERVFNIKSVIDEESFDDNQRVLKEIVELLQRYKIRYPSKQQHLSDFFERLLTTGLKQEAGQFFTPPPITRFIIRSLPIENILVEHINQKSPKLPAMIDYAVGSGHFLTEIMEEYQSIINRVDISNFKTDAKKKIQKWRIDEYDWASKYIYGVDIDYRLVKVAKVGCYFYGDGLAQVIHGDGLDNFKQSKKYRGLLKENSKEPQFQFVLSNPPYSVSAFKTNMRSEDAKKDFSLFNSLTDRSSEIECLFIERTKHLLKSGGIAALILPSSILSNTGIQTKTRELLLKSFDIVAIAELGSNTFMATGTNTVTLFLKRKDDSIAVSIGESINKSFDELKDNSIASIEKPIGKYIAHVWEGITIEDYITLIKKTPNEKIENHEIYKNYTKKIKSRNELDLMSKIIDTEKEKLLYYILAFNQRIVLVKTGSKKKEKQFLGFEFSNRRGNEGMHPIQRSRTIDECTQLYDAKQIDNPEKASTYIYKAFNNELDLEIPEKLKKNISYQNLVDMLTFDRFDFEKSISLSVKKKVNIDSKWKVVKLNEIIDVLESGNRPKGGVGEYLNGIPSIGGEHIGLDGKLEVTPENIKYVPIEYFKNASRGTLKNLDILICKDGALTGKTALYQDNNLVPSLKSMINEHVFLLRTNHRALQRYLFNFLLCKEGQDLLTSNITGQAQGGLNRTNLTNIKIPLPPLDIQQKIVAKIEELESKESIAVEGIISLRNALDNTILNNKGTLKRLDEVCLLKAGKFVKANNIQEFKTNISYPCYGGNGLRGYTDTFTNEGEFSLVGRQGALCGNVHFVSGKFYATEHALVAYPLNEVNNVWLHYKLLSMNLNQHATGTAQPGLSVMNLNPIEVYLPPLSEQKKIVAEIEKIESKINELEKQLADIPTQKEAILKKYL